MELVKARILLENLLKRVEKLENGSLQLSGTLTPDELEAIHFAVSLLDSDPPSGPSVVARPPLGPHQQLEQGTPLELEEDQGVRPMEVVSLDLTAFNPPPIPPNVRLCIDFGTAMSKATLVEDNVVGEHEDDAVENISVLKLGIAGEQEEVNETMLISSVYVDNEGLLWFGKSAVNRSKDEVGYGVRRRLDNIKQSVSEGVLDEVVPKTYNPTKTQVTYGDMVLGYLTYLTWAVNDRLKNEGYSPYLPRRFALPCLADAEANDAMREMAKYLGEAQVLADSFGSEVKEGIKLSRFVAAVQLLRSKRGKYNFIDESVKEPLGVANSMLSWRDSIRPFLMMIIDVGAGTSDFSLFSIGIDPEKGTNNALEVAGSARGITEAGDYLDDILMEFLLKKGNVTSENEDHLIIRGILELGIRDYKETLFNEKALTVVLSNNVVVEVNLNEFLSLGAVIQFGASLRRTMQGVLDDIDTSWANRIQADPTRRLVIAATGGGASLPMVQELSKGSINVHGTEIELAAAIPFPKWLSKIDANLEVDYPRIAVSLGGARKNLIKSVGKATITADVTKSS